MKKLKPILYEIICSYCQKEYGFKLYNDNGIQESKERPKYDKDKTIVLKSHGICETCLPEAYRQNGMDLEYLMMKKKKD